MVRPLVITSGLGQSKSQVEIAAPRPRQRAHSIVQNNINDGFNFDFDFAAGPKSNGAVYQQQHPASPPTPDDSVHSLDRPVSEPDCLSYLNYAYDDWSHSSKKKDLAPRRRTKGYQPLPVPAEALGSQAQKINFRYSDPGGTVEHMQGLSRIRTMPSTEWGYVPIGLDRSTEHQETGKVKFAVAPTMSLSNRLRADKKKIPGNLKLGLGQGKPCEEAQRTPYPETPKSGWDLDDEDDEGSSPRWKTFKLGSSPPKAQAPSQPKQSPDGTKGFGKLFAKVTDAVFSTENGKREKRAEKLKLSIQHPF